MSFGGSTLKTADSATGLAVRMCSYVTSDAAIAAQCRRLYDVKMKAADVARIRRDYVKKNRYAMDGGVNFAPLANDGAETRHAQNAREGSAKLLAAIEAFSERRARAS